MSANVYWEPIKRSKTSLNVYAPSAFKEAMERAFQKDFPIELTEDDREKLEGMAALFNGEGKNPYEAMLYAIEKHEQIEVSLEY